MNNYKTFFKIQLLISLFSFGFATAQTLQIPNDKKSVLVIGPTGHLIPIPGGPPAQHICTVNGVTITTGGTSNGGLYAQPSPANLTCSPLSPYLADGDWTYAGNPNGFVKYTFSQPITSARISYSAIDSQDIGTITIDGTSPVQLYNPCGVNVSGNVISCNYIGAVYGDIAITVGSVTPFTVITLRNTGQQTGWVIGNPCNFIINPPLPIVNCPKVTLDTRYYSTSVQNTTLSVFTAGSGGGCSQATINGVPCTAANVTIEPVTPLQSGCTFNTNGTIRIAAGTLPFYTGNIYNYRFRSIANPNIYSVPYRVDFGIQPRVLLSNLNNVYLTVKPTNLNGFPNPGGIANPYGSASNLIKNVLTGSTIYTSTTGGSGTATANSDAASAVTVTETTSPTDPYFMINSNGDIVYRPNINTSTVTIPALPSQKRELTFTVCLANGCANFFNTGSSSINYFYPPLRSAPSSTSLDSFTISPNPIKAGQCQISFEKTIDNVTLEVHALTGEKLHTQKLNNTTEELLLLDKLPKGIYVLKIITENQTVSKKISVE